MISRTGESESESVRVFARRDEGKRRRKENENESSQNAHNSKSDLTRLCLARVKKVHRSSGKNNACGNIKGTSPSRS